MSERESTYWICDACADKRGLEPFKIGNTVIKGLCGNCTRPDEAMLTPIRDFRRKLEAKHE